MKLPTADRKCTGPCERSLPPTPQFFRAREDSADGLHKQCLECERAAAKARRQRPIASGLLEPHENPLEVDPQIVRLIALAKKSISFSDLCNALDSSPKKTEALLRKAAERNAPIHVEHDTITVRRALPVSDSVADIKLTRSVGDTIRLGAISDTHLGSKYCLRGAIRDVIHWMHAEGVRDILHSGDVLEGCYRHSLFELSHSGFDDQLRDAAKCFPELEGLRYHFISGNHDFTFEEKIGMRAGMAIQSGMRALGRNDWLCYGDRNAYLRIGGAVVNLWHPGGGSAYARSYNLQKRIEAYTAIKPHILLMGHYHQYCYVYERGIHGIMMPTFQGSGSNFAQSLKGSPAIGGLILEWQMSETGRIHNFNPRPRFFFEKDTIFNPRNDLDAIELPAVGRERRYKQQHDSE